MKTTMHRPIRDAAPVTLLELVGAVGSLAASAAETAQVINHMLITGRIRFVEALDREEISLLLS